MAKHIKHSVLPIYLVGVASLIYALVLPFCQPVHYLACAGVCAVVFVVGKAIFPDKAYSLPGEKAEEKQEAPKKEAPKSTGNPEIDTLLKERERALGEMRRLFREGSAVRVSRGLRDLGRKVQREADRAREGGRPAPSLEELARELGVSPERAALALGALQPPLSLTAGEEGETWEIPVEAPEEGMTERLTLYGAMERMDPGDRELLRLRYFLGKTQTQTGEALGMTQVQVSRREKKLLLLLRRLMEG